MDIYLFLTAVTVTILVSFVAPRRPVFAFVVMVLTVFVFADLSLRGV